MKLFTNPWNSVAVLLAGALTIGAMGCSPPPAADSEVTPTTGDSHDHPETLGEAVEMLSKQYAEIKAAFDAGTPDDAHGALHDVAHTMSEVNQFATDLPEESKASVATTVDTLMNSFGELDGSLHGVSEEIDFAAIDAKIAEAMKTLTELAAK
ncbi:MAG: hypothetical protein AAGG44_19350 [Planctomycetota bacterium]